MLCMLVCGYGVAVLWVVCVFFKQKTAYDIEYGLVGSEMCIRDRGMVEPGSPDRGGGVVPDGGPVGLKQRGFNLLPGAVSYTHLTLPTSDLV